jgi:hypothetical protein
LRAQGGRDIRTACHRQARVLVISSDTYIVRIPSADVPRDLKSEVESVLAELIPLSTARVKEKRQTDFKSLLDVLSRGVKLRTLDIRRAQKQARAPEAVLENSEWLTAEEIGERMDLTRHIDLYPVSNPF